ncbi:MAG: alpha/beta fold hydrolase [Candidatus Limnocylindrales bacterium]
MATLHHGLAVYRFGQGSPIFFMPGPHRFQRPGTRSGDALIEGLTGLGREVVTFDPPGSGRSTRPARLTMGEMVDCAEEALDACAVGGPVDALGHSMGGLALLAFALDRPARVSRLVLVGTGTGGRAYMHAPGALWNRTHPHFWRLAVLGMLRTAWPRLAPERLLRNLIERESFVDGRLARPTPVRLGDWVRPPEGRTDWHRVAAKLDYGPRLAEIHVPTLVLCGRADPQYPAACSAELAAGIAGSRLAWFDRSGHFPFIEEPAPFWAALAGFLNRGGPAARDTALAADESRLVAPSASPIARVEVGR